MMPRQLPRLIVEFSRSILEFDRFSSTAATIRSRFVRTFLTNFTRTRMRHRLARRSRHSRCIDASSGLCGQWGRLDNALAT